MAYVTRNGALGYPATGATVYVYEAGTTSTANVGQLTDLAGNNISNPITVPADAFWGFEPPTRMKLDVYWSEGVKYLVEDAILKDPYQPSDVGLAPSQIWEAMGIYVGVAEPTLKTYAQWLASGTGYWAWVDISAETVNPAVTMTGGLVMGGSMSVTRHVKVATTEGLVVGGQFTVVTSTPQSEQVTMSGGLVIGGEFTVVAGNLQSAQVSMTGGLVMSGDMAIKVGKVVAMTGGLVIGGAWSTTGTSAASSNSFGPETFDSGLGAFSILTGTPANNGSGEVTFNAAESMYVATTMDRTSGNGFYVQFDVTLEAAGDFDTQGVGIKISNVADLVNGNWYEVAVYRGDEEGEYASYEVRYRHSTLQTTPLSVHSGTPPVLMNAKRTVRAEFYSGSAGGGNANKIRVKVDGSYVTVEVGSETHSTLSSFSNLMVFQALAGYTNLVDNVSIGSL